MSKVNTVVIVGRVNVGKSTLFNRLTEDVRSITLDYEGVTRDFLKDSIKWRDSEFDLIDTGGIELGKTADEILKRVRQVVVNLIEKADLIIFMADGKTGVVPMDIEIAKVVRDLQKKVVVAVNKIDVKEAKENLLDFYQLGFEKIIGISAEHGLGMNELLDYVVENLPKKTLIDEDKPEFKIVFLGRPNAGKSSLMNLLLQEERTIVSEKPGTTREAISENILFYKQSIELTDTPGIRRKRAVSGEVEPLMVKSSFQAMRDSDIVVLVIDGSDSNLVDQELKLAFYSFYEHYKALILVINKHDLMTDLDKENLEYNFEYYKHLIKRIPVLQISCKTGKNVGRLLPTIKKLWERYNVKFDDLELNTLFIEGLQRKPLYRSGNLLQVYRVRQLKSAPIIIQINVNEPKWFGPSQLTYFENLMRYKYDMLGVPVKFIVKKGKS